MSRLSGSGQAFLYLLIQRDSSGYRHIGAKRRTVKQPMSNHKKKQVKLIYYSHHGTELQEVNLGWKKILSLVVMCLSVLLLLVSFILGFFSQLSDNWQVMSLARAHKRLSSTIGDMYVRMDKIEGVIERIEKQDSSLNVFVDAPFVPPKPFFLSRTLTNLGLGKSATVLVDQDEVQQQKQLLDELDQCLQKATHDRAEITDHYNAKLQQLKQTPSIRPLLTGRMTDRFGMRMDPLVERVMYHTGIDFSAPRGTQVFASADGIVREVAARPRVGSAYGRFVLIDHGFGRETRYAHLEDIHVRVGQAVSRHMLIGSVGDSGRSTGPHLHYEVLEKGKTVNPEDFILN